MDRREWLVLRAGIAGLAVLVAAGPCFAAAADQKGYAYAVSGAGDSTVSVAWAGDGAYLGVQLEEETEHAEGGARVTRVVDDSPADKGGLKEGDIIVRFEGDVIRGPAALTKRIHAGEPGDRVSVVVLRDGAERTLEIEMGQRSARVWSTGGDDMIFVGPDWDRKLDEFNDRLAEIYVTPRSFSFSSDCEGDDCRTFTLGLPGRPVLGVQLVEVTPELREHLGGSDDAGVLVSKIVEGSPAENAGIAVGDLIVTVGGDTIEDTGDLRRALRDKRGKTFDVEVIRDGRSRSISVTVPAPEEDQPTGPRAGVRPRAEARESYRAARSLAHVTARTAQSEAREAYREARQLAREATREGRSRALDSYRDAQRRFRDMQRRQLRSLTVL